MANPTDFDRAQGHLDQASEELRLSGKSADEADLTRTNRAHGRDDVAFGEAAVAAVEGCGEAYAGVPVTSKSLGDKLARLKGLRAFKGGLEELLRQTNQEINWLRVDVASDVDLVTQAAEAVQLHPGTAPALKKRAARAAQPLMALREGRKDAVRSALSASRAVSAKVTSTEEEKSALQGEVEQLRLENKFLAEGALRPDDLPSRKAAPTPATAPARARRRSKR